MSIIIAALTPKQTINLIKAMHIAQEPIADIVATCRQFANIFPAVYKTQYKDQLICPTCLSELVEYQGRAAKLMICSRSRGHYQIPVVGKKEVFHD
jgi:hypothetical protein